MRVKVTPKNVFLIISLLLTVVLGGVSYFFAKNQFEAYIISNHESYLQSYTNSLASEFFNFSTTTSLKVSGKPKEYIDSLMRNKNIKAAKITDANGTIISSSNLAEINLGLLEDDLWQSAISGSVKNDSLTTGTGNVNFYIPLVSQNEVVRGVVIINSQLPEGYFTVRQFTNYVLYIVFGASISFIIISYFAMYELEQKMEEKERSISDQSRAQTEEKQLYEAIASSITEALIVVNKNHQIIMINPGAENLMGHKSCDIEYRSYEKIIIFFDQDGKKIKKDPISTVLKGKNSIHISSKDGYYVKSETGKLMPVAINIAPIFDKRTFINGAVLTITDISAEKELQKVKDEFVYVVAHELGNPIFALDGYLSILESDSKHCDSRTKEILNNARCINKQLSGLVNDLLEVARNETGRLTFDLEPIDVPLIVKEVVQNEMFHAKEKKITISISGTKVSKAIGNNQKIKEVITNLVNNAIKYTPNGGTVKIIFNMDNNHLVTSVTDSGIGISEENQKQLFKKFFRVKNRTTVGISGTGLGLFIAKQIVEKCGGEIWAKSTEEKGSTFSFNLKTSK